MTKDQAEFLVRERIKGNRKGSSVPAFQHSINVYEILKKHEFPEDVCLAGLLHDIIEDGDITKEELLDFGFSPEVCSLVSLCTHEIGSRKGSDAKWVLLIAKILKADYRPVWAIKVADTLDNVKSCHTLTKDREKFIKEVKAPLVLSLSKHRLGDSKLWLELKQSI